MKSKSTYSLICFRTILQNIIVISMIWQEIRDSVFYFLEKNADHFSDLTFDVILSFAELLDELLGRVKNLKKGFSSLSNKDDSPFYNH